MLDKQSANPRIPRGCCLADERVIAKIRADVGLKPGEGLNDQFGSSYDSWRKLMAGQPVRSSLLARLEERLNLDKER